MKQILLSIGFFLLSNALFASEINPASIIPAWVQTPPDKTASACSILSRGELVAQKIAKAKAMAELGRTQKANVKSSQEIEANVNNGRLINSSFKETTAVTSDEFLESVGVIDQAKVSIDGNMQLCVLIGAKEKSPHE
jgi:hypothetical protein